MSVNRHMSFVIMLAAVAILPKAAFADQIIRVSPSNLAGWSAGSSSGGSTTFISGPATPPVSGGSVRLQVPGSTDKARIATSALNGVSLTALAADLSYSTFVTSFADGQAIFVNIYVDLNGNGLWDGFPTDDWLAFEPNYQNGTYSVVPGDGPIPDQCSGRIRCAVLGEWQRWDAGAGGWWSENDGNIGPPLHTLQGYATAHPGARLANGIPAFALSAGSGWTGFDGNADAVHVNGRLFDFNSDATTPTEITGAPHGTTSSGLVQLSGTAGGGVVQISIVEQTGGGGNAGGGYTELTRVNVVNGAWSATVALAEGAHTILARGLDASGGILTTSDPVTFTVADTIAPAVPAISLPAEGAHMGRASVLVAGTSEPHSTVSLYAEDVLASTMTTNADGGWNTTLSFTMGAHRLRATAHDLAGNASESSAERHFEIDQVAPPAPKIASPEPGVLLGPAQTITGTADPNSRISAEVDAHALGSVVADASGRWSLGLALPTGAHTIAVRATDEAGNSGVATSTISFEVDAAAPSVTIATPNRSIYTPLDTVTITGAVADNRALGSITITYSDGLTGVTVARVEATCQACTPQSKTSDWSDAPDLGPGVYTVAVMATDQVGNRSQPSYVSLIVI